MATMLDTPVVPTGTVTVLVAVREPLVGLGLRAAFEQTQDCTYVGAVSDPGELADAVGALAQRVVLLDATFHKEDPTLLGRFSVEFPDSRFVLLVHHTEEECILRSVAGKERSWRFSRDALEHMGECCLLALQAGGRGCVPRGASLTRLLDTVRQVASGEIAAGPWLSAEWIESASARVRQARAGSITPREMQIIAMVGRGLSNKHIGSELGIREQTVKNHLGRVMAKIGVENRVELAVFARTNRIA
jgi:DNA-binding NarL/FixJ family response regulator